VSQGIGGTPAGPVARQREPKPLLGRIVMGLLVLVTVAMAVLPWAGATSLFLSRAGNALVPAFLTTLIAIDLSDRQRRSGGNGHAVAYAALCGLAWATWAAGVSGLVGSSAVSCASFVPPFTALILDSLARRKEKRAGSAPAADRTTSDVLIGVVSFAVLVAILLVARR
jgi:hypothetical protein